MDDQSATPTQPQPDTPAILPDKEVIAPEPQIIPEPAIEQPDQSTIPTNETLPPPEAPGETQDPQTEPAPPDDPIPSTDPVVQSTDPAPLPEPMPEQSNVPEPTPNFDNSPTPTVVIPTSIEVNTVPETVQISPTNTSEIPAAVLALTPEELKIAARLYITRNQKEISAKGVAKRQARMQRNLEKIVVYLTTHGSSPLPRIAKATNVSPGTTSSYLRRLTSANRIKATGHGKNRRFFV